MRGNPIGQEQKLLEPLCLRSPVGCHLHPGVSPTDHRAQGNHQNVQQEVQLAPVYTGVSQLRKVLLERRGPRFRHGRSPPSASFPFTAVAYARALPSVSTRSLLNFPRLYMRSPWHTDEVPLTLPVLSRIMRGVGGMMISPCLYSPVTSCSARRAVRVTRAVTRTVAVRPSTSTA